LCKPELCGLGALSVKANPQVFAISANMKLKMRADADNQRMQIRTCLLVIVD